MIQYSAQRVEDTKRFVVQTLVERFSPDKVVLFGSRARGDARPDSDLDVMVVFNDLPREAKRDRAKDLYRALIPAEMPVEIVVANRQDVTDGAKIPGFV